MGYNKKLPFFIAILKQYLSQHFVKLDVFLVSHPATIWLTLLNFWLINDDKVAYLLGKFY